MYATGTATESVLSELAMTTAATSCHDAPWVAKRSNRELATVSPADGWAGVPGVKSAKAWMALITASVVVTMVPVPGLAPT